MAKLSFYIKPIQGDASALKGILTAFATINDENGTVQLIAVSGDYRKNRTLKDFLNSEIGDIEGKELDGFIEELKNGDVKKRHRDEILKRLDSLPDMEVIPVPARIELFKTKEEVLRRPGDIFDLGIFQSHANAQLTVSAFPILYQAIFREQESELIRSQIDQMLLGIENQEVTEEDIASFGSYQGSLMHHITTYWIPKLMNPENDSDSYQFNKAKFLLFMADSPLPELNFQLIDLMSKLSQGDPKVKQRLELLLKKIIALKEEAFEELKLIEASLRSLED